MRAPGLPTAVLTHSATISTCEKGRQWQRVLALFEATRSLGLQNDVITYGAAISACETGR